MDNTEAVAAFWKEYEKYSGMWQSIEVRALLGGRQEEWIVLTAYFCLRDRKPASFGASTLFDGAGVKVVHEWRPISESTAIVQSLSQETMGFSGLEARLPFTLDGRTRSYDFNVAVAKSHELRVPPFGEIVLSAFSDTIDRFVDMNRIQTELRNWGYPQGLVEMTRERFGTSIDAHSRRAWVGIIGPKYLVADGVGLPDTAIVRPLVGTSVANSDVRVRYEAQGQTGQDILQKGTLSLQNAHRATEEQFDRLNLNIALPEGTNRARLSFFYKNNYIPVDSIVVPVVPKSSRSTAMHALGSLTEPRGRGHVESALDMLRQSLGVTGHVLDASQFEGGVATLLTLAGYRVISLGKGKAFDIQGIDLLAFQEEIRQMVAVSCTIDNRLSNKVEGLLKRVSVLRKTMTGWEVCGIVFAPLRRKDITIGSYLDLAHAGLGLALRNEIRQLLEFASSKRSSRDNLSQLGGEAACLSGIIPAWPELFNHPFDLRIEGDDLE